ncbi:MAG: hypothetical protein WCS62_05170, partial [Bacilli bacterium]
GIIVGTEPGGRNLQLNYGGQDKYSVGGINRIPLFVGAGGAGGSAGGSGKAGGVGGRGGGCLYIECAGALSISSTLNASGTAGGAGNSDDGLGGTRYGGGGGGSKLSGGNGSAISTTDSGPGGGGGGGVIIILYKTLTENTGTYIITGGAAGTASKLTAGAGGNGYSLISQYK